MTESERITALEARLAKAEARIAELEARPLVGFMPNGMREWGPDYPPGWVPGPIVAKADDTSGMPPVSWKLPTTCEPGAVIHCGPDGPVAIKPEPTLGQEVAGEIRARREVRQDGADGNAHYKRWLGTV